MPISVVILAAGQGTRMRSSLPKVLHPLAGRPMLAHVIEAARQLDPANIIVVYGHGGTVLRERLADMPVSWAEQARQLGTGHAVAQALPGVPPDHTVVVLYGDVPMVRPATLKRLAAAGTSTLALVTAELDPPKGYGRIIRNARRVTRIVEEKDATPEQRAVREINTGLLAAPAAALRRWIEALDNKNAQSEYYLTDVVAMAASGGMEIETVAPEDPVEFLGVNDKAQLARLERAYQLRQAQRLMSVGVTLADPARLDVRGELIVGKDVSIDVNVVFEGRVVLGDGVRVGPNVVLRDVTLANDVEIKSHSCLEEATIGAGSVVGPFARIRPGTVLAADVHIGNFVEIKKSNIGAHSKVNHLSYVGDAVIGERVNVGAGTITCNYDGADKHQTVIEDDVFVGSDTQLVAPVTVGRGATIGAGSTITRDAPPGELTLSRSRQETRTGWTRPVKKKAT